jgi:hypothetical protein
LYTMKDRKSSVSANFSTNEDFCLPTSVVSSCLDQVRISFNPCVYVLYQLLLYFSYLKKVTHCFKAPYHYLGEFGFTFSLPLSCTWIEAEAVKRTTSLPGLFLFYTHRR